MLRKIFIATLPFYLLFSWLHALTPHIENRIRIIDEQIHELQEKKLGYEARVIRHEDQADRLQFNDETYLETRRHIQLADENRAKAVAIQQEIDRLMLEREKLLKK